MKKISFTIFSFLFLFFAQIVFAESITHFHSNININKDATVDIIENITYDFGDSSRHGIYRDIPVKYYTGNGIKYTADIDNIVAKIDNKTQVPFAVMKEGENIRIKIGDPDSTITGKHTYVISYTVHDAITYFDDHQEFYWNVTGNEWPVKINTVTTSVSAPNIEKTTCFAGGYGSDLICDSIGDIRQSNNNSVATFTQNALDAYEGMTIVAGMPIDTVYKPTTVEKIIKFIMDNWILLLPIVVFIVIWYMWWRYGRDPKGTGIVVPYYDSPEGLSPAEIGMIVDERVDDGDIAAALIDIAVKGHMLIRKDESGDYIFIKKKEGREDMSVGEQKLYNSLFENGKEKVVLADLKNKFYKDLTAIKDVIVQEIISKGFYTKNPQEQRNVYMMVGAILMFGSFFTMSSFGVLYGLAFFLSALPIFGFGWFMPRRTKKGVLMSEKVLGLKLYLETAEKDRINFHNAPEKNPERFEKLLPYAIALGVERQWAKQFDDIYKGRPDWYESSDPFTATALAHEMSSLTNASSSVLSSQPSSAASGGSGFSSGGGFSGGGFGGGGGGSW